MRKRILALVLCLSMLLISVTACGGTTSGSPNASGSTANAPAKDTLTVVVGNEPTTLDPYGKNDSTSAIFKMQIYDTLFKLGDDGTAEANICKEYEYKDDTTLVMTLRDDVTFHNGEKMTPQDVLFSIRQTFNSSYLNPFVDVIDLEKSTVNEDGTITLTLTQPCGPLLNQLCYVYIVPQAEFEKLGQDGFANAPVGSGPYVYSQWVRGDRVDYKAFDGYWGAKAAIPNLSIRIVAEAASRSVEIETAGADIALDISASDLEQMEGNADLQLLRADSWNNCYIGFDCSTEPFNNVKLRQAVSSAIDTASIVKAVYGSTGSVADGPISPAIWGYKTGLAPYSYNVEKAKALLAEAGYPNGLDIKISISNAQLRIDIATMLQSQLAAIGVNATVDTMENSTYLNGIVNKEFKMYILTWPTYTGDADYGLNDTFNSKSAAWANTARYSNPTVDALLEEAAVTLDEAKRLELYAQVQDTLVEECPWIWLWNSENIAVCRNNVKGLTVPPSGRYQLNLVSFG